VQKSKKRHKEKEGKNNKGHMVVSVEVRFFASIREVLDTDKLKLDLPDGADTNTLLDELIQLFPDIKDYLEGVAIAVNQSYVTTVARLNQNDTVALIPPISGG
jgi:molybdopterin converting factor subunit 1